MLDRRDLLIAAAQVGLIYVWASPRPAQARGVRRERRELFPQGVASGDPSPDSVILWTRCPGASAQPAQLILEVAEDESFSHLIAEAIVSAEAAADWTCRVRLANLKSRTRYWFRFVHPSGGASRVGRTMTAPAPDDPRPVQFAVASCQNINLGYAHAYRRMIFDDRRAADNAQLHFVLHLGDFIYETVWQPEDFPQGRWGRPVRETIRFPSAARDGDAHVPANLEEYRALYRAYLGDDDIQDARARWPFIAIWDNHEFSQSGWQSLVQVNGVATPRQTLKAAANQAWFEYQPALVRAHGAPLAQFSSPQLVDHPIDHFDQNGFGDEANNRAAVESVQAYRAIRWGAQVELLITDQRSYRSRNPFGMVEARRFATPGFPDFIPERVAHALDAGNARGARALNEIATGLGPIANYRRDQGPQTLLGAVQKAWFMDTLARSSATWKIWANSLGAMEWRADLHVLERTDWPHDDYALIPSVDYSCAFIERSELYDWVARQSISGFVTLSGDRHSFWAGYAAASLAPHRFEPIGVAFVAGAISTPGLAEMMRADLSAGPERTLFFGESGGADGAAINILLRHGVRAAQDYHATGALSSARALSNPDLAPHLAFVDVDGAGYSIVKADGARLSCRFVCIPAPATAQSALDGGPLRYQIVHTAPLWRPGERPRLEQTLVDGAFEPA